MAPAPPPSTASGPGSSGPDPVATARHLADELLFPAAAAVDAADAVPVAHLDALAAAGLYAVAGPRAAGGLEVDLATMGAVVEALAGGDLTTAFVWVQHHSLVRALGGKGAPDALRDRWLAPLCRGERRAGIALGGLLPGPPPLRGRPAGDGWVLDGVSPWVTGWRLVDVLHVAARGPDDAVVWLLLDAAEEPGLTATRQPLVAVHASRTVTLAFDGLHVPAERVVAVHPYDPGATSTPPALRVNGSLALGLAGRCCRLLGPSPLDDEVAACRAALDAAGPAEVGPARAAASQLALRAAAALVVHEGSAAVVRGSHAERLARQALFLLVFGTRPAIRTSLLERFGLPPG